MNQSISRPNLGVTLLPTRYLREVGSFHPQAHQKSISPGLLSLAAWGWRLKSDRLAQLLRNFSEAFRPTTKTNKQHHYFRRLGSPIFCNERPAKNLRQVNEWLRARWSKPVEWQGQLGNHPPFKVPPVFTHNLRFCVECCFDVP